MSYRHPSRPSGGAWAASIVWAGLSFVSCGLATPLTIGFAAFWLRSGWQFLAACAYAFSTGIFVIAISAYDDVNDIPEPFSTLVSLMFVAAWIAGVIHSGILVPAMAKARPGITASRPHAPPPPPRPRPNVHHQTTAPPPTIGRASPNGSGTIGCSSRWVAVAKAWSISPWRPTGPGWP